MRAFIENNTWKYKIILAGEAGVGKTTLVTQYISGGFSGEYRATIGCDVFTKQSEENKIDLHIWDVAGQILFRKYRKKFFIDSQGVFLIFDLTIPNSLEKLDIWINDIKEVCKISPPCVLIGNKKDLNELRAIDHSHISKFMTNYSCIISYRSVSAKTGENVDYAFSDLFHHLNINN